MRFCLDEVQIDFQTQLRALTDKECKSSDVREAWISPLGWSPRRWGKLAEMGVVGITVEQAYGGIGLGFVDLVLALEEAGRACLPEPVLETAGLAAPLLAALSTEQGEAARLEWLPRIAGGKAVATVGLLEMGAVPAAEGADLILLEAGGTGGRQLHALPADQAEFRPVRALDGAVRLAHVEWEPSDSTLVASGAETEALVSAVRRRGATGSAAVLLGLAHRMVFLAVQHASERRQFGHPIGSFQAVKHQIASAAVRLEFARPVVYRSALSIDRDDPDSDLHASMAKALASEAALEAARTALQVHGAIGYTWEHELHLWMKKAWAFASAWGDARSHRARVLEGLLHQRASAGA